MPRLFTGLEVPDFVAREISMLRGGLHGAKWMDPADYHVTLRFVGDVDGATARDIFFELSRIRKPAVTLSFDGLSAFGGDKPRAIILRLKPNLAMDALYQEHERVMRKVGLAPETRKFTPHITIARLRNVKPIGVAEYLSVRGLASPPQFTSNEFAIFSSRDSTGGGPYIVEATYPLGLPGEAAATL